MKMGSTYGDLGYTGVGISSVEVVGCAVLGFDARKRGAGWERKKHGADSQIRSILGSSSVF